MILKYLKLFILAYLIFTGKLLFGQRISDKITDASTGRNLPGNCNILNNLTLNLAVNNLFDIFPDKNYLDPRNHQNNLRGDPTQNYTTGRDNASNGHFLYSRTVTQFGFNGRFISSRLTFKF